MRYLFTGEFEVAAIVAVVGVFEHLQLEQQGLQRRSRSADYTCAQLNPAPQKWNVDGAEELREAN